MSNADPPPTDLQKATPKPSTFDEYIRSQELELKRKDFEQRVSEWQNNEVSDKAERERRIQKKVREDSLASRLGRGFVTSFPLIVTLFTLGFGYIQFSRTQQATAIQFSRTQQATADAQFNTAVVNATMEIFKASIEARMTYLLKRDNLYSEVAASAGMLLQVANEQNWNTNSKSYENALDEYGRKYRATILASDIEMFNAAKLVHLGGTYLRNRSPHEEASALSQIKKFWSPRPLSELQDGNFKYGLKPLVENLQNTIAHAISKEPDPGELPSLAMIIQQVRGQMKAGLTEHQ